jgi:hypothetical protein
MGKRKAKDRIGIPYAEANEEKREHLVGGN